MRVTGLVIAITTAEIWKVLLAIIPAGDFPFVAPFVNTLLTVILILSVVEALFSIGGGIFALQRRKWGWALAGSIVAIFGVFPLGLASTIFVVRAKDEFE